MGIDDNTIVAETFKNLTEVLEMFRWSLAGNEKVIHIIIAELQTPKHFIHEPLKGLGSIL